MQPPMAAAMLAPLDFDFSPAPDAAAGAAGRCLLPNGIEHRCTYEKMSTSHTAVSIDTRLITRNDIVICSFPSVGIIPEMITNIYSSGFIMKNILSHDRLPEFSDAVRRHQALVQEAADRRAAPRIVPKQRSVRVWYSEGKSAPGVIDNLSITGAAIAMKAEDIPFHGSVVKVGSSYSAVVRSTSDQIGVRFLAPISIKAFDENFIL